MWARQLPSINPLLRWQYCSTSMPPSMFLRRQRNYQVLLVLLSGLGHVTKDEGYWCLFGTLCMVCRLVGVHHCELRLGYSSVETEFVVDQCWDGNMIFPLNSFVRQRHDRHQRTTPIPDGRGGSIFPYLFSIPGQEAWTLPKISPTPSNLDMMVVPPKNWMKSGEDFQMLDEKETNAHASTFGHQFNFQVFLI